MRISDWSSDVCSSDLPSGPSRGIQDADTLLAPHGAGDLDLLILRERQHTEAPPCHWDIQCLAAAARHHVHQGKVPLQRRQFDDESATPPSGHLIPTVEEKRQLSVMGKELQVVGS